MRETKARRRVAGNAELTVVHRAVMRRAEHDEVFGLVRATLGARLDVMQVDEGRVPAPRDDAAALVAAEDVTAQRWRDRLRGAVAGVHGTAAGVHGMPFYVGRHR